MPSPSLPTLLAESRWLESLARTLVTHPADADDLVQDVWTAAAEHAPPRLTHPRAWLATILRNTLHSRRRADATRTTREHTAARADSLPSTIDIVTRADAQRRLVTHVLALEEPWRSTVLWHWFDGTSAADIAARERIPASTVRNRLADAHARLRARLEREHGRDWTSSLAALASVRDATLASGKGTFLGGGLVAAATKLACAAAAVIALAFWWSSTRDGEKADIAHDVAHAPAALDAPQGAEPDTNAVTRAVAAHVADAAATPPAPARIAKPRAARLPPGVLAGIVLDDDRPYVGAALVELLAGSDQPHGDRAAYEQRLAAITDRRTTRLDADACFRFDGVAPGDHTLQLDLPPRPPVRAIVSLGEDLGDQVELHVGSASLSGHVWDADARPLTNVTVQLSHKPLPNTTLLAVTDDDGHYSLAGLAAGDHHLSLARGSGKGDILVDIHTSVTLARGEARTLDFGRKTPLPHWRGTVRGASGTEHRGSATVEAVRVGARRTPERFVCADGGRFDARLEPGTYSVRVRIDRWNDASLDAGTVEIGEHDLELDLALPGLCVRGRVVADETGEPIASLRGAPLAPSVSLRTPGCAGPSCTTSVQVEPDGRFSIEGLEPGRYLLTTWRQPLARVDRDGLPIELVAGQPDAELELRVVTR